jgi:hypothetical protein
VQSRWETRRPGCTGEPTPRGYIAANLEGPAGRTVPSVDCPAPPPVINRTPRRLNGQRRDPSHRLCPVGSLRHRAVRPHVQDRGRVLATKDPLNDGPTAGEMSRLWHTIVEANVGSRDGASVRPFERPPPRLAVRMAARDEAWRLVSDRPHHPPTLPAAALSPASRLGTSRNGTKPGKGVPGVSVGGRWGDWIVTHLHPTHTPSIGLKSVNPSVDVWEDPRRARQAPIPARPSQGRHSPQP